ncbi:hypothetical protein BU197_10370 [Streptomyces sp. CBMA291]|nr:hypothetical protein [Streptomyces sp. CBMA291]MBD0714727.1 hypothetical protein [Streptomyces sp. CBMA370]
MEPTEEVVERVSSCGGMPVSVFASVVSIGFGGGGEGGEVPEEADVDEAAAAASARSSTAWQVASNCLSRARSWWPKTSSAPGGWWAYSARKSSRGRSASASQPRRRPLRLAGQYRH